MADLTVLQQTSEVLWCFIWTAHGQSQQDKGFPLPQLIFRMRVAGTATLLSLQLQSKRKHMGICLAPFCHSCISGQAGEEMAHSGLHTMQYHVQSGLLLELVVWQSISILQCSPAEIRCCRLGGTTSFWVLDFTVSVTSLKLFLKGDRLPDGVFAKIQMSARQCQPPECPQARRILAKGTFDLSQERISCIFRAASHSSCLKPFV